MKQMRMRVVYRLLFVTNLGYLSSLSHASDVQMSAEELEGVGQA
jgi:hypothetical protein